MAWDCVAGSTSEEKREEINLCNLNLRVSADLCLLIHKRLYLNADVYCSCITNFSSENLRTC